MNVSPLRLCAALFVVVPASSLMAQRSAVPETPTMRLMALELLARNANEASERAELAASRPVKPAPLSAANFDANKDGKLDDKEFAAWTAELRKVATRTPAAMKKFDTDKDGALSDAEWSAAVTELFGER